MKINRVAIYSGEVPSTTFIERLIEGLSRKETEIYLFGKLNKRTKYSGKVIKVTFSNNLSKYCLLIYYTILLQLKFPDDKRRLDKFIKSRGGNINAKKVKFYPVLYHRPSIFHLQWAKGISEWIWVEDFNIRLILSLRGTHITISPFTNDKLANDYRTFFPKVSRFHAVSEAIAKTACGFGIDKSRIKVIYSGLNLQELPFHNRRRNNNNGKITILSIGRAHWVKGYECALDAMCLLKSKKVAFEYRIIGFRNDESLSFQCLQLGLEKEVVFEGKRSFDEIKKLILESDILLLPSVEEGIANVVLEAMALGTLVVSTDCGGMSEVIDSGKNGFLVEIRNPEAIVNSIVKVLELTDEEHETMLLKARKTVEKQHSESKMVEEMEQLYNQVINL